jgi:hypothetical protein
MPEERDVKNMYIWALLASRPFEWPNIRWIDKVMKNYNSFHYSPKIEMVWSRRKNA